ncbi:MAG: hypothetical protein MPN21_12140 [Thermoanaerobaculia bacterium]|nr:hypothetical protein [Thermoanaerobaculia bacterium]
MPRFLQSYHLSLILVAMLVVAACSDPAPQTSSPTAQPEQSESRQGYDPAMARTLAVQSMQIEDAAQAEAALRQATSLAPTMIDGWLLLASVRLRQGDLDGAFGHLEQVSGLGVRPPVDVFAPLQPLHADPRWSDLLAKLDQYRTPEGASDVLFTLTENDLLTEGIAYDAQRDTWYVSAVHGRKIVQIGPDGTISDWLADREDLWGVFGLAVDGERRRLWAATAAMPQMRGFDAEAGMQTALLELDLEKAEIVGRYELPPAASAASEPSADAPPAGRQLNDLVVAQDGTVYTTDLRPPGGIYRLVPGSGGLERVGESMLLNSPQGIALLDGDSILVVADYSLGLVALDLATGESWFVEPSADLWLQALDGLVAFGDGELVAIQNGRYPPHRILRLQLDADRRRVTSWSVAARALPEWREPTLGTVVRDGTLSRFVYVAASQWALFPDGGEPDVAQLEPPKIMSLELASSP